MDSVGNSNLFGKSSIIYKRELQKAAEESKTHDTEDDGSKNPVNAIKQVSQKVVSSKVLSDYIQALETSDFVNGRVLTPVLKLKSEASEKEKTEEAEETDNTDKIDEETEAAKAINRRNLIQMGFTAEQIDQYFEWSTAERQYVVKSDVEINDRRITTKEELFKALHKSGTVFGLPEGSEELNSVIQMLTNVLKTKFPDINDSTVNKIIDVIAEYDAELNSSNIMNFINEFNEEDIYQDNLSDKVSDSDTSSDEKTDKSDNEPSSETSSFGTLLKKSIPKNIDEQLNKTRVSD